MRIPGPSRTDLNRLGDEFAETVTAAMRLAVRVASKDLKTTSTPDDLSPIRQVFTERLDEVLMPALLDAWTTAVQEQRIEILESTGLRRVTAARKMTPPADDDLLRKLLLASALTAAGPVILPPVADDLSVQYLATARNRLVGVSDEVWGHARDQMVAGMQAGESIRELKDRIALSTDLAKPRAEVIARTEVIGASNRGSLEQVKAAGYPASKTWLATGGPRTRPTHATANGQTVRLEESFTVGGFPMDGPHDPAGPPEETISCRCTLTFEIDDDQVPEAEPVTTLDNWELASPGRGPRPTDGTSMFGTKIIEAPANQALRQDIMAWAEGNQEVMTRMRREAATGTGKLTAQYTVNRSSWVTHRDGNITLYRGVAGDAAQTEDLSLTSWTSIRSEAESWASSEGGKGKVIERIVPVDDVFAVLRHEEMGGLAEFIVYNPTGAATQAEARLLASADTSATLAAADGGGTMPWHVERDGGDCGGDTPWAVIKDDDGSTAGCHATEQEANDQMDALYANEEDTADTEELAKKEDCPPGMKMDPDSGECMKMDDDTETAGGKPNQGTKKDKRLQENKKSESTGLAKFVIGWFQDNPDRKPTSDEDLEAALNWAREQVGKPYITTGTTTSSTGGTTTVTITDPFASKTKINTAGPMAGWSGTICVEGITSGDQREFAKDALTWADPPIPLRWKKEDSHGGVNDVTVAVGHITAISRKGHNILGEGTFDLGSEDGREAHRRVKEGFLAGISIDADDITDADVELVWPEAGPEEGEEEDLWAMLFASPEKVVYHAGRIRAATLVDIPAFVEAKIQLDDSVTATAGEPAAVTDARLLAEMKNTVVAGAALTQGYRPPRSWFENPKLSVPMNVIVTDEGRVYGHAAYWSECHIGHPDMCVTAPYEDSHPYYMTGEMVCDDGTRVQVGQITLDTGHAPLAYSARRAAEHYDNTGTAVADVTVGNDDHGIWIAGAVRPDVDPNRIRDLRAAGKVSGDWRRIGGSLRLVGLLGVPVAGFHSSKVRSRVAGGKQLALVAAGIPNVGGSNVDLEKRALQMMMDRLAQKIRKE